MATKYDVQPGTFESVSGDEIGTFVLDQWTHFKLDGEFPFLVSDVVIKQGAATVPGSAYELSTDAAATAQEVGLTDKTLYGMIRITNVTYVGVTLNFTGSNFGTYGSNEAVRLHVATEVAVKMQPGSDAFIQLGEPAIFNSSSGLQAISDNSGEIALWDTGPVYSVAGTLVRLEGLTFAATGQASNQNKNPLDPNNALFWYMPEDENDLLKYANRGTIINGDLHTIHDRSSGNYVVNFKIGKKKINSVQQEFHIIHLDGTQVTGNTTLENLLDVGGANEYIYLDLIAPDVVGTRTLLDMGGRTLRSQSVSGKADTLGELQEDAMQKITGDYSEAFLRHATFTTTGVFNAPSFGAQAPAIGSGAGTTLEFDSSNSVSPNTAKTDDDETRMANMVVGSSYIVIMQQA